VARLHPAEELLVELDAQVGMQAALEEDLVAAEGERLLDLLRELLLAEQVPFLRREVAVERAERALGRAAVRVFDVAVDVVGDAPAGGGWGRAGAGGWAGRERWGAPGGGAPPPRSRAPPGRAFPGAPSPPPHGTLSWGTRGWPPGGGARR